MTAATTLIAIPAASQSSPDRSVLCDPIWHKSAPREIRDVCGPQGGRTSLPGWDAWRKRLADTSRPTLFCQLPRGRTNPLTWALPDEASHGATRLLLAQLSPLLFRRGVIAPTMESLVREWLADGLSAGVGYAWESLAWCYGLARLASVVSSEAWWDLLEHLLGIADRASSLDLRQEPVTHQLLAGELPLALACLLPEINACRKRSPGARRQLSRGLRDLLDGEGFPRATHLDMLRPLLACWTRAAALGSRLPKGCWNESAQGQYRWLVRQALRTTRSDGSHVLSRGPAGTRCDDLFAAALHFGGDETARQMASIVLPPGKRTDRRTAPGFPAPAEHSEWAQAAVLRARWLPSCPRLTVLFPDQTVRIELESAGEVLWSGQWDAQIRRDGGLVAPRSTWRETCWVSNDEVDYLELELRLTGSLRIQRHLVLARRDGFLLLADAVLGRRPTRLEYQGCLPLAEQTTFQPADETREGRLWSGGKPRALVLPLALPEWLVDHRVGTLAAVDGRLELRQTAEGRSLLAPLWIDLEPRRLVLQPTWRQLTVAEKLAAVPHDVAAGYRVKIGQRQWMLYRALAGRGNRTLLGHNLITETLLARFVEGEVEPLVEIE